MHCWHSASILCNQHLGSGSANPAPGCSHVVPAVLVSVCAADVPTPQAQGAYTGAKGSDRSWSQLTQSSCGRHAHQHPDTAGAIMDTAQGSAVSAAQTMPCCQPASVPMHYRACMQACMNHASSPKQASGPGMPLHPRTMHTCRCHVGIRCTCIRLWDSKHCVG
jgi:hypothetical protein